MTTDVAVEVTDMAFELRVIDRCDVAFCGAQAFVATGHGPEKLPLLWCQHHFIRWEPYLLEAVMLADKRDTLNEKPSVSAY